MPPNIETRINSTTIGVENLFFIKPLFSSSFDNITNNT